MAAPPDTATRPPGSPPATPPGAGGGRRAALDLSQPGARRAVGALSLIVILAAWQLGVWSGVLNANSFPPPTVLAQTFWELATLGFPRGVVLWDHFVATVVRILTGYAVGSAAAIPLGLFIGRTFFIDRATNPIVTFARSVAAISLLPLAVAWFGVGEVSRVFLITYGVFWVVLTNSIQGVKSVDPDLVRAGRVLGTSRLTLFTRVLVPATMPRILAGMKVALGLGFMVIVAAEMIGTVTGLGALINEARTFYRTDIAIVGMVAIAVLGVVLTKGLDLAERVIFPWASRAETE